MYKQLTFESVILLLRNRKITLKNKVLGSFSYDAMSESIKRSFNFMKDILEQDFISFFQTQNNC